MKLLIAILFSVVEAWASLSAYRAPDKDYEIYEMKYLKNLTLAARGNSPLGRARYYKVDSEFEAVQWSSLEQMNQLFNRIRDEAIIDSNRDYVRDRRISWLYPQDGCWIRAILFNRLAFRNFVPLPNTVYAFGKLSAKTPNTSSGRVDWWFHVAPIVQVGEKKYVLDPAIEPAHPLELSDWLGRMGKPEKIKVAICGPGTNSPGSSCTRGNNGLEFWAMQDQKYFLKLEWNNLRRLGRDPVTELSDRPPWRKSF